MKNKGGGFTLVELLVVTAIIGILVAMLLPAVQAARESGRRVQCGNNLKQLALGCFSHETARGILPDGGVHYWMGRSFLNGVPAVAPNQNWGWGYQVLPYIDQYALWNNSNDAVVYGTAMPIFFCPTRRQPQAINATSVGEGPEIRA